jgi:hypothetical protein
VAIDNIPRLGQNWFIERCRFCNTEVRKDTFGWIDITDGDGCSDEEAINGVHDGQKPGMLFVNAYAVTRHYGGREEGGWWFDAGSPLASIPCLTNEQCDEAIQRLRSIFEEEYEALRDRFSVIGEADLRISVEDVIATPWPTERPHYE